MSNSRNAYRLSSGNEPIEGLRARLTIVGGGRGAKGDKWREGATTRGGKGEEGGEGGRESEIVREEKRSASMSMSAALRLGEPCLCGLFSISINNVKRVDGMLMGGR